MSKQSFNIGDMPVEQLAQLKEQVASELEHLTNGLQQLANVTQRIFMAGATAESLSKETGEKQLLFPLTPSLYVEGVLADSQNLLVDVGTGYYCEKSAPEAADYCKRRINRLRENMEALQNEIMEKRQAVGMISQVLSIKMAQAAAGSGGGGKGVVKPSPA